jgi:hypothetical protein
MTDKELAIDVKDETNPRAKRSFGQFMRKYFLEGLLF